MMSVHVLGCQMAAADFRACTALLETLDPGSPLARLLRGKLLAARPVADSVLDPGVVTINSRVDYEVDGEEPQTRLLVGSEFRNGLVGLTLPITTMRGMALLGLRAGQTFHFEESGRLRTVVVRRLAYQPQAARLGRAPVKPAGNMTEVVRLVERRAAEGRLR